MAMKNPWSRMPAGDLAREDEEVLSAVGAQALKAGVVTPGQVVDASRKIEAQAAKAAKAQEKAEAKAAAKPIPQSMATPETVQGGPPALAQDMSDSFSQAGLERPSLPPGYSRVGRDRYYDELKKASDRQTTTKQDTTWSPDEYARMGDQIMGYTPGPYQPDPEMPGEFIQLPGTQDERNPLYQQKRGLEDQAALIAMETSPEVRSGTMDWSPIMALVDSQTGSNLMKGYKAPEDRTSLVKRLNDYALKMQDDRKDLASKYAEGIKSLRSGSTLDQLVEKMGYLRGAGINPQAPQSAGSGGRGGFREEQALDKAWAIFKDNKVAGKVLDSLQYIPVALGQIERGTKMDAEMLKRSMIQLSGDDRPSDRDVGAFGGSSLILERAKQAWDWSVGKGTFTPKNQEETAAIIRGMAGVSKMRFDKLVRKNAEAAQRVYPSLRSVPVEDIALTLSNRAGYTPDDLGGYLSKAEELKVTRPEREKAAKAAQTPAAPNIDAKMKKLDELTKKLDALKAGGAAK